MQHAHDVVYRAVVYGQAGVAGLVVYARYLLHRGGVLYGAYVHAGGEYLLHVAVVELYRRAYQRALVLVYAAVVLGLVHVGHQLVLGYGALLVVDLRDELVQALLQRQEEVAEREQHARQHRHYRRGEGGKLLGPLLGQRLGRDLAKYQHQHGHHHGAERDARVAPVLGEQHRGQRGGGDVYEVVAYQYGGEQLVVALGQRKGEPGPAVAVFGQRLEAYAVDAEKGGLGRGEERTHQQQKRQYEDL